MCLVNVSLFKKMTKYKKQNLGEIFCLDSFGAIEYYSFTH